jgi:hypothetical protein
MVVAAVCRDNQVVLVLMLSRLYALVIWVLILLVVCATYFVLDQQHLALTTAADVLDVTLISLDVDLTTSVLKVA